LATDRYELTMVDAALRSGIADRQAVFEVFTRRLPAGRRYGVVAGVGRVIDAITRFRFGPEDLRALDDLSDGPLPMSAEFRAWLANYRFTGDIDGYPEGELFGPHSPILTVRGTFADTVVIETVVLSILNHDCAVAAGASRMVEAAAGRPLIEMGSRRTDPDAAVAAARAAVIAGFSRTSNLEAGRRFGLATAGTAAHAFTLAHPTELEAFLAQIGAQGVATTLLVDTYEIESGIHNAVAAAREYGVAGPGAIRIDSGDLGLESKKARCLLDELGAHATRIVLSGDLDAASIAQLVAADIPVDLFGVGTSVVTGDGHPTASLAYKLVEIETEFGVMTPVSKRSAGKASFGGRKSAYRLGSLDVLTHYGHVAPADARPLQVAHVVGGVGIFQEDLPAASARLQESLRELGSASLQTDLSRLSTEEDRNDR
jgi:nicotinate phosphoribosyltransferase